MSPICPACGCSLVRLKITRVDAASYVHEGQEYLLCCQGCVEIFEKDPETYLEEIRDWIVCPTCLAEKPKAMTVSISHEGQQVHFCRCPCCVDEFKKRPDELLAQLQL